MSILVPLCVGVLAAWLAHKYDLRNYFKEAARITLPEYVLGAFVIVVLAVIVTMVVGPNLSRDSATNGYHQFYNGSVTQARIIPDTCEEDGSCAHHYTCDHEVIHHSATYDSKGNMISPAWDEDVYHQCPYVKRELAYVLDTNIGQSFTIADGYFDANPQQWRGGHSIPGDVPRQPPPRWLKAKTDAANGVSDPVTGVKPYANFILASDNDLFKKYDGYVAMYMRAGLLPKHTANLSSDNMLFDYQTQAAKVQAVGGLKVANLRDWQDRLMRFNAALGSDLQGDMHIVLVPAIKVPDPDKYITALKAYWTKLGKWSIAKNGIILAIGVNSDGKSMAWSRADTGMPVGNNTMKDALKLRLTDVPFDPAALLGFVTTTIRKDGDKLKVVYDHSASGAIGKIMFADYPFKRPCMQCTGKDDKGVGYVDLKDLVPITTGAKVWMFFIVFVLSLVFWGLMLAFDPLEAVIPSGLNRRFGSNDSFR